MQLHEMDTKQLFQQGFTLIEIMITVAIIGILAAIAIPNFRSYQLKSKTTEVKNNLSAISKSEVAFKAEWSGYSSIAATPVNGTPKKVPWVIVAPLQPGIGGGAGSFEDIGFRPSGAVYYTYAVAIGPDASGNANMETTADAIADLDGNGSLGIFATALTERTPPVLSGIQSGANIPQGTNIIENFTPGDY